MRLKLIEAQLGSPLAAIANSRSGGFRDIPYVSADGSYPKNGGSTDAAVHNLARYNVHAARAWRKLTAPAAAHHAEPPPLCLRIQSSEKTPRAWTRYIRTDIIQPPAWLRCQVFGEEQLTTSSLIALSIFEACVERMINLRFQ
jgi:hypothetical protein